MLRGALFAERPVPGVPGTDRLFRVVTGLLSPAVRPLVPVRGPTAAHCCGRLIAPVTPRPAASGRCPFPRVVLGYRPWLARTPPPTKWPRAGHVPFG
ncbi:hypothetical protein SBRY_10308 [Actinacidiphila bryophytorum]|uniref:Uncharacterized protein n=1 Tax=Actinacidiphila bryophytorum TaxID=1436133 RepID=A0A9W4GVZ1_9ACTN|nr:hypothetical protein SBRY_10308 [Actinacidiphila bryophytorum]